MALLNLREKTVVLVGPMTPMMQSLTMGLTQLGADVGLINSEIETSQRFAGQITDAREVNSSFGRAFALQTDFTEVTEIKEAISKVAETFGGIDTYIDTRSTFNLSWGKENSDKKFDESEISNSKQQVAEEVIPFLRGRKKGRIIFLAQQPIFDEEVNSKEFQEANDRLVENVKQWGEELSPFNVCVNLVQVTLTEEYLLYHFKGMAIQEALEALHRDHPGLTITEFERVANVVSFLVSGLSLGLTGQLLEVR